MRFRFRYPALSPFPRPSSFAPRSALFPVIPASFSPTFAKTPWHSQSLALLSLAVARGNHFHSFSPRKTAKHFRSSALSSQSSTFGPCLCGEV